MRFSCPSCAKELAISDEKLPPVDRFIVNCPDCQEKLVIDKARVANPVRLMAESPPEPPPMRSVLEDSLPVRPVLEEESGSFGMGEMGGSGVSGVSHVPPTGVSIVRDPAPPPGDEVAVGVAHDSATPVAPAPPPVSSPAAVPAPVESGGEPEIFPPGSKVVFLYLADPGWSEGAREFFRDQGYYTSTATDSGEATAKLRLNAYNVLLVEDNEEGRLLLKEVGGWSGVRRRECNVALVGEGASSLDPQPAFRLGVNSWLNRADAGRCSELLGEVLKGYELYYELLRMAQQQGREE